MLPSSLTRPIDRARRKALTSRDRHPAVHEIASSANARVKLLRAIAGSRGVRRHGRALVCGARIVAELVRRHPERIESLVYPAGDPALARDLDTPPLPATETLVLPRALFEEIDPFGVEPPLAVIAVMPLPAWDPAVERVGFTLVLPLGDPENVGAALRSAAAFGIDRVVLLEEAAHPFHPRAIRASAGACFDLALRSGPSVEALLAARPAGIELLVLDREGEPLANVAANADLALLVGEEGRGIPSRAGVRRVTIPIAPPVDSLNAAVAVSIALWELRGRPAKGRS
jgi:tRNA G18 (ribose-2'-O)-methylase SpoU